MKRILNKLTRILIISVLIILTIIGCKVQEQIKVGVTPVSQITPVFTSYPAQLTPEPDIISTKIPINTPKSIETPKKVESYVFVTKWGSEGSEDGQFKNSRLSKKFYPVSIAVDKDGNLYITDPGNYRIQKFDSTGGFILKWSSEDIGKEMFKYFSNIAVDLDNNVYVTEYPDDYPRKSHIYYIQKFTSYGEFITKWAIKLEEIKRLNRILYKEWREFSPSEAQDILVSKDKYVYTVYDYDKYVIYKYDSEGNVITTRDVGFGSGSYDRDASHRIMCGTAIDSKSNIFVLFERVYLPISDYPDDPNTYYPPAINFIMKFDSNGHLIKEYKEIYDDKNKKILDCNDIAIDSKNNIFISSGVHQCIWKFDSNLNFITKFGSKNPKDGKLEYPYSLAVDSKDNVYVVDAGDFSIKKFKLKH